MAIQGRDSAYGQTTSGGGYLDFSLRSQGDGTGAMLIAAAAIGGPFLVMPTPTTNGTPLVSGPTGVEISLPPGASVTYTVASSQPSSAPSMTRTVSNPSSATSYYAEQVNTAAGNAVYVTAASGGAFYRSV